MNFEEQLRCERDCARLSHDFAYTVDRGDHDGFIALFAPDGALERGGQVLRGPQALRDFLEGMPVDRTMRHLCSNVRIDMTGPDTATGTSGVLMLHAMVAQGTPLPVPAAAPVCAEYVDDYVRTTQGWKFKYRKTIVVFKA